jgi:hypothetical protein
MMNSFKTAAILILTQERKPLHYKEITRLAIEKGILETSGNTPDLSMNSQIAVEIKNLGESSDFIRVEPGVFALNQNKKPLPTKENKKAVAVEKEEEREKISSSYIGKGGEHIVCAELLFRGYNASIMSVDVGMDLTATKEGKLFSVQVKTSNINSYNTYNFDVRKVSFEKSHSGNVFYIFVLKSEKETNYLILPLYEMEKKVHEKAIIEIPSYEKYRVKLDVREGKIYLGNRTHDMTYYLNNWTIIK